MDLFWILKVFLLGWVGTVYAADNPLTSTPGIRNITCSSVNNLIYPSSRMTYLNAHDAESKVSSLIVPKLLKGVSYKEECLAGHLDHFSCCFLYYCSCDCVHNSWKIERGVRINSNFNFFF